MKYAVQSQFGQYWSITDFKFKNVPDEYDLWNTQGEIERYLQLRRIIVRKPILKCVEYYQQ